ncbi:glycosyltransferase family 2 protein [Aquisphaera insulae]|uniref:glycosyltransferase family 2 protein n=1 Tax=Aquisphaera insulae TaxID=2712864 RepID=UPI0013ED0743|nr:glycosyltransferase family 2 protein [Aquisphaera insulae]
MLGSCTQSVQGVEFEPIPPDSRAERLEVPFITVVVPVRNEAPFIARTIQQLAGQDYRTDRFEVLVIDGGSTDATRSIAESLASRHSNLRVLENPRRLSSAARNIGIREARGELIVVVDGHCELEGRRYLRDLADAFARSGADCIGRPQPLDVTGATPLQRAIAAARSSWLGHHPDSFIYSTEEQFVPAQSVAVAYRREVFDRVGAFDERFDACEDVELNHRLDRAGVRCFFTPTAQVRYFPRSSLLGLFRQMSRYGRGRVRLLRKHPETFSPGGLIPAAWLMGLSVGPLLAMTWPPLWWIYGGTIAVYLLAVLATSAVIAAQRREPRLLGWLPLVFSTVHAGAGWGALAEFVAGCRLIVPPG